jgi:serine/threonine protein kinase
VIAVKELTVKERVVKEWASEVRALRTMNALGEEHIVRFITAFRRGKPDNLEHYLVFEWADGGTLRDL